MLDDFRYDVGCGPAFPCLMVFIILHLNGVFIDKRLSTVLNGTPVKAIKQKKYKNFYLAS